MKFNKEIAIILVLVSMLLSALAVSFYFYKQNKEISKSKNEMVTIYIAKALIKKDTIIKAEHLSKTQIAKQYILNKPLVKKEILGKYAKESVFKNEIFIKDKLSDKISYRSDEEILEHKFNSYNMSFKLFSNANYSIKPDDRINIVSVYQSSSSKIKGGAKNYAVRYVAKDLRVLGFLRNGHTTTKTIVKKTIKKVVKKKQVTATVEVKADDIILDIGNKTLLALIKDYNKGKQLWMTKINKSKKEEVKEVKKVKKDTKKPKVKRSYPVRWYSVSNKSTTKTALIEYKDKPALNSRKNALIISGYEKECKQRDNLLIGISNKVYLREKPLFGTKIKRVVYRNYIIPYTNKSEKNKDWYRTCDGKYVHTNEVNVISYEKAKAFNPKAKAPSAKAKVSSTKGK